MKKRAIAILCCCLVLGLNVSPIVAQTEFRKALQEKFDFKTVSCYTCHARAKPGTENPKQYRNEFGKEFDKLLEGKNVTARLDEVKVLSSDDAAKQKVEQAVTDEFLDALERVEQTKSPAGKTYGELLKSGELDGVQLKD